ncbi:hypothetical protein KPL78_19215 [Roseomonas sp. HJA6]|uniref:Small CPxCG-related zinc finger protein n=1 Tax=Roseomonas alba TaxID=2846776 RepID=A0ABS7ACH1_9PROT|nr:hypothetical protein [Neoroseomonas alba]MBW6399999.1 hypothetical protein [Neoroseomonas alba]
MSDPIDLSAARAQRDGASFMDCPTCGADNPDTNWAVVCRFNGTQPFIAALLCTACETEIVVEFGTLVAVKPHGA